MNEIKLIGKIPYTKDGVDKWLLILATDVSDNAKERGAIGYEIKQEYTKIDCKDLKLGAVKIEYESNPFSNYRRLTQICNVEEVKS